MKHLLYILFACATLMSCSESFDERTYRETKEFTKKNCPAPITRVLALDSMTFDINSHTLNSYYSLSPKEDIELDKERTSEALLTELRNNTGYIKYKNAGFSFRYIYYLCGKPNDHLLDVTFKPKDYM